ncbi:39S ribosomal protein L22, mitochondrial [Polyrhizophydium stewartii]|uniref:39S ribosomal protein L22, mitochondrial n=1 Tax=Polyrhizophydium stewartii TaxID=2732419 RepID=A0ABR4NFZ1_9FUNG|nr:54S ribosomal protein L22, mitochondrial [Polyrhizophydium stewartii]
MQQLRMSSGPSVSATPDVSPLFQAAMQEARSSAAGAPAAQPAQPAGPALGKPVLDKPKTPEEIFATRAEAASRLPVFTTGNMRVSPQKLNHLARLLRRQTIEEAKRQMNHTLKRRGVRVASLLHRIEAALRHNYNLDPADFVIAQAFVGKGTYLKRIRIHGRGRFGIMHHPSAHIKVMLGPRPNDKTPAEKEMAIIARRLVKRKLFVNVHDSRPIQQLHPVWSSKPWKYVTSPKWTDPNIVVAKPRA